MKEKLQNQDPQTVFEANDIGFEYIETDPNVQREPNFDSDQYGRQAVASQARYTPIA